MHTRALRDWTSANGPPHGQGSTLEGVIRQRIAARLGKRIRHLVVAVEKGVIHLSGECSTYYSKQLAQHAVLGVVEDESIVNEIEVAVPRSISHQ